ncbi:MAG TPA: hypothetical protein VF083_09295 [Acidimicrobiia bacterium]
MSGFLARTFLDRLLGLRRAPPGSALVMRARSVHGFGMRQAIPVIGLDADMRVVSTRTLRPNRVIVVPPARLLVELPPGRPMPRIGDRVEVTRD